MRLGTCLSVLALFQLSGTPAAIPAERIASQASAKPPKDSSDLLLPPSEDLSRAWDEIGGKLVEMAQDFPEDKYDFKVQKDQRTFAETLLHIANDDFLAITAVKGSQAGPDFHGEHPSRAVYKSKADVVKLLKDAVAAGSAVIKAQGDAGLDKAIFSPFTADPVRVSTLWWSVLEDDGEHYGQLVVYYRANNLVPPRSR
jgi:DinB family protein